MRAKSVQSCPTLYGPMDCSPPGSSIHGIFQVRILEWVAMPSSRGSFDPGLEPGSSALQADSLPSEPSGKPHMILYNNIITFLKNPLFLCCPPPLNPKGFVQNTGPACMDLAHTYCSALGSFHESLCLRETAHHCFSGDTSVSLTSFL